MIYMGVVQEAVLDDYRRNGYWNAIQWPAEVVRGRDEYYWFQLRPGPFGTGDETVDSVFVGPFLEADTDREAARVKAGLIAKGERVVTYVDAQKCPKCKWEYGMDESYLTPCVEH